MNRRNSGGGPGHHPETAAENKTDTATKQPSPDQTSAAVRVLGRFYGPSARRSLGVLIVTACPFCPSGGPHVHRGTGGLRRSGCMQGEYVLVPVPTLSERKGAAA